MQTKLAKSETQLRDERKTNCHAEKAEKNQSKCYKN